MDNEIREIIKEAWNIGGRNTTKFQNLSDTFGDFLTRATRAIYDAGYRKVDPKGLTARDYADAIIRIFEAYRADLLRRLEVKDVT